MIAITVGVFLLASWARAEENCDTRDLSACLELIPKSPVGLPRSQAELDQHCKAYDTGMVCMDPWIRRCLPGDSQRLVQQQTGGARVLMHFLCSNDSSVRKDYLREATCWQRVSADWSQCVHELQAAVKDISDKQNTYYHANGDLCCARDAFMGCVAGVSVRCSAAGAGLLRRLAWVLAQDVAACGGPGRARCAAAALAARLALVPLLARVVDVF